MILWRPTRTSRTNTQKRCPFHYRGLEYKSRKSRNTCSNKQIWPWSTEWSRAKALVIANTLFKQHNRRLYIWTSPDGQHLAQARWGRWLCVWQPDMGCQSSWDVIESTGRTWGLKILWLYSAWASLLAQMVKNLPVMRETWIQSLGQDNPLEEGMATHSSILAWRILIDRDDWWATVHGVTKSQIWLSDSA